MSESESVDSPAFVRQRRNLIVASLVLAIAMQTNLTINKLSFLGLEGSISAPVSTVPYLWALCAYFLWRYWIAFVASHRVSTVDRYKLVKKKFLETLAVAKVGETFSGRRVARTWMPHEGEEGTTREGATVLMVVDTAEQDGAGGRIQRNTEVVLSPWEFRWVRTRTIVHLIATADEFSEYYLPFAIAALPLVIALVRCL